MATRIAARDCMPFLLNNKSYSKDNIIPANSDKGHIKALTQFVDSIIPVSIFNDNSLKDDVESKLAYSPFENQPLVFRKDNINHISRIITYVDIKKGKQPKLISFPSAPITKKKAACEKSPSIV